jgi:hypothetical protein
MDEELKTILFKFNEYGETIKLVNLIYERNNPHDDKIISIHKTNYFDDLSLYIASVETYLSKNKMVDKIRLLIGSFLFKVGEFMKNAVNKDWNSKEEFASVNESFDEISEELDKLIKL